MQRPSLSRTLGEMVADGVIALDKQEVTVLDRRKLQSYM
ncbi:helix-turn-helix domain-containing protein [Bacteroides heparinolyticus]